MALFSGLTGTTFLGFDSETALRSSIYFMELVLISSLQIPKPNETEGLGVGWPAQETDMDKLKALHEELKSKI